MGTSKKLQADRHVAACDGSSALQKCATGKQIPCATGVSHLRNVFTPLSVISKTGLSAHAATVLRSLKTQGAVQERLTHFAITVGDQCAEALAGAGKKQLRRMNLLGGRPGKHEHANVLAAHYLLKQPGLDRVLRALAIFRCKVSGVVAPSDAFKKAPWSI